MRLSLASATPTWGIGSLVVLAVVAVAASLVLPLIAIFTGPTLLGASVVAVRSARRWEARAIALVTAGLGAGCSLLAVVVFVSVAV
jgi:hypothetical protein